MRMYDIILKKRGGGSLSPEEIRFFITGYVKGQIPDYQVSALMMAIYFQGMDPVETQILVEAMVTSGDQIDLSGIAGIKVDKHSTGGVGDKTTIVLAPLVAACGAPVAKLSGRGLGHTGGTLDKLEAFTGFSSDMEIGTFIRNVNENGIAIAGQTANLVPADKKLYALRDVTATVENFSLIAGSIMSKKLAGGADAIVLDVKCGDGAFMKDLESARQLASAMVEIGQRAGRNTQAVITSMSQPLGYAVGNALEVREAIDTLRGHGPEDLVELCLELGSRMLLLGQITDDLPSGRELLKEKINNGEALAKLRTLIQAQGGDPRQVDQPELLPQAKYQKEIRLEAGGYVHGIVASDIGTASMVLGAGRESKESQLDLAAGVVLRAKTGDFVPDGGVLAEIHSSSSEKLEEAEHIIRNAIRIQADSAMRPPLILDTVSPDYQ